VVDVCRQLGVSEATFYTWKKKYADLGVSELRKLKQIEDENTSNASRPIPFSKELPQLRQVLYF